MLNKSSMKFTQIASNGIWLKNKINNNNKTKLQPLRPDHYSTRNILLKEDINDLTIIGQFDKKFLLLIRNSDNSLVIFDQHAVHERVLYEYYTSLLKNAIYGFELKEKSNNAKLNLFEDIYEKYQLPKAVELNINHYSVDIEQFAQLYSMQKVQSFLFFDFIICKDRDTIKLLSVPIIFDKIHKLEKLICIFLLMLSNFNVYLKELNDNGDNRIAIKTNKIIMLFDSWIRSKACRNAIKFNNKLDEDYIKLLMHNLSECLNPFLCAHGRHNFFIIKQKAI